MRGRSAFALSGVLLLAATLVGCGGGGGGTESGDGSGGSTPPPSTSTGLVPAAPAVGAILYSDAKPLRPLIAGAKWTYRGTTSGTSATYTDVVTQSAADNGVLEVGSNPDNTGAQSQNVYASGGAIHIPSTLSLDGTHVVQVDAIDLRSPVRVNDQFTLYDGALDSGRDFDGDGKTDSVEVAIYTRVVGQETLDLTNVPQVTAVRVTTTTLLRAKSSKTGEYSDVVSGTQDNWYAPGLGIVKHVTDAPSVDGSRIVTTETLETFDGVTTGLGNLDTVPATAPDGTQLKTLAGAVSFDTKALLLTYTGDFAAQGYTLSSVDARGKVTASHSYTSDLSFTLFRVGNEARVLSTGFNGIRLQAYDADGVATGAPPVTIRATPPNIAPLGGDNQIVGAASGDVLWLIWAEPPVSPSTNYTLIATPFNMAGQQLSAPTVLATNSTSLEFVNLRASGSPNRVFISWDDSALSARRYATIEGSALTATVHPDGLGPFSLYGSYAAATSQGSALFWIDFLQPTPTFNGVEFDAAGVLLRAKPSVPVEAEALGLTWVTNPTSLTSSSNATVVDTFVQAAGPLYADEQAPGRISVVTEFTLGAGPLATTGKARYLARGTFPVPSNMVSLTDRVLLLNGLGPVSVTPVWRRQ